MAIYRDKDKKQYTNISNEIFRNQELSLRDRGLLATLLSLPDNWVYSVEGLAHILKKDGKHTIRSALASLEEHGYLVRRQLKSEDGKFQGCEWEIYEVPRTGLTDTDYQKAEKLTAVKSISENQSQSNSNKEIKNKVITIQSSEEELYKSKWCYSLVIEQTSEKVAQIVFEELVKNSNKEKITPQDFYNICQQIENYEKPIGNFRAFVKSCIKNYFESPAIQCQPKKKNRDGSLRAEYDFEQLEREILCNYSKTGKD